MPGPSYDFSGKVALITGGGSGLGRAAALAFARAGARVCVVDMVEDGGNATAASARDMGGEAIFIKADVSQSAEVRAYVEGALRAFGRIDAFFNNAGIEGVLAPIVEYPEDTWDRVIAVNVRGVFLGLRHVLPVMLAQASGSIINSASGAALFGTPGMAAYSTSKHAVIGLTRSAAAEVARKGVRVNALCPGPIDTRMQHAINAMINPENPAAAAAANHARNPMGRYASADEVAQVALFLASDAASYVTGAAYLADGGRTAV